MMMCCLRTLLISSILISLIAARHIKRGAKATKLKDRSAQHKLQKNPRFQHKEQHLQYLQNSGLSSSDAEKIIDMYNYQYEHYENIVPEGNAQILEQKSNTIPQKDEVIKPAASFIITNKPDTSISSTSEYYPSTPPWYPPGIQNKDTNIYNKDGDLLGSIYSYATRVPPSTTGDVSQCPCQDIENDKLLTIILSSPDQYDQRRLALVQMGLYSAEQARRCYQFCINRSTLTSHSFSTKNLQTYPPGRQNSIEIATESVDPKAANYDRFHCYEIMLSKTATKFCMHSNYSPTNDSPKPSTSPKGKNVWTCCKSIATYGSYYNY